MNEPQEVQGVWITFRYAPYEGCRGIIPHATERSALEHLAQMSEPDRVQFVPFGEELDP
jgi:hypothetical protein